LSNQCTRQMSVSETLVETLHLVSNTHINPLGTLHGGYALLWMVTTASMAAMKVARGPALIAHLDNVFFLNPVRLGKNAVVTAWVELVGRTSMEITALLEEEDPYTGHRTLTTAATMTYVAVDESLRPRPVPTCVIARTPLEEELQARALERRRTRKRPPKGEPPPLRPLLPALQRTTYKLVNPEDTLAYNALHGGKLLHLMDEISGITAMLYARGPVVTAAVDATDFLEPVLVGEILEVKAAVTYIGRTSIEVSVQALAMNPYLDKPKHTATSYFTVVHLDSQGRPAPVPPFTPKEEWQKQLAREAEERRTRRIQQLQYFKSEIENIKPPKPR